MSFLEKVKNMFTEEVEEDEVKVEKIKNDSKKTNKLKSEKFEKREEYEEDESVDEIVEKKDNLINFNSEEKKAKPVFFSDDDFDDIEERERKRNEERIRLERERYEREVREKERLELLRREELRKRQFEESQNNTNYYEKGQERNTYEYGNAIPKEDKKVVEPKKIFKPTPIISPVYGVLDKNYHKEDIVSKEEVMARKEANVSSPIDLVRNKAYGTLEDELENTLFGNNSILFKNEDNAQDENESDSSIEEISKDDLSSLTDDIGKELDELLSKKGIKNDSKKAQKKSNDIEDDLLEFIDSTLYKKGEE